MVSLDAKLIAALGASKAILVRVHAARGSVPREVGAWMAVFADSTVGSVGGGHLEWQAIARARRMLQEMQCTEEIARFSLGASLGQCCGGEVHLRFQRVGCEDVAALQGVLAPARVPVALFGGGHVGSALMEVLSRLPMDLVWIDSREAIFDRDVPANVRCEHSDPVQDAVADLPAHSRVLIMSFSHAEDLEVVAACLQRQRTRDDLPYIGLIGSKTKWASFRSKLRLRGYHDAEIDRVTCPVGIAGIVDKRPEVIAVAIAAQLLQVAPY